ncbi:hypothetical protein IQ264_04775 [Phormidium sp. LEGE 05292]|uniref:hypothetical protein n=1 Tax=[Phormidium] sp. LEGE 05292 TaxID=767427 RepID=UPI00187E4835|nr:hypothetical protein [Phormidium sp. LEGE 05292]MBE9224781.1 hypothetical protein [Phormidium sp. LEGE 05292]
MSNQPKIPDAQTRARHIANLQEICQRWDTLIAGLDELDARLDAEFQNSPMAAFYKRRAQRFATQQQESSSQT